MEGRGTERRKEKDIVETGDEDNDNNNKEKDSRKVSMESKNE